jgi:hypothetical protein
MAGRLNKEKEMGCICGRGKIYWILRAWRVPGLKKQPIDFIPNRPRARVAELADALDLGSSGETCRGSNPLSRTTSKV